LYVILYGERVVLSIFAGNKNAPVEIRIGSISLKRLGEFKILTLFKKYLVWTFEVQ